jgi:UDP-N-acetylglucosamine 2-epimerase
VNIGDRQKGRLRGSNVIDVPGDAAAIASALTTALSPSFRERVRETVSPFGDGHAAEKIGPVLLSWEPPVQLRKRFFESPG